MKHKRLVQLAAGSIVTTLYCASALGATVSWTDWISSPNQFSAVGRLQVGSMTVDVNYSGTGAHNFVQTGTGTNFWTGTAYTNGSVDNAPPAAEMVALSQGGTVTITLSQTVVDPLIGLVSWNSNTVNFSVPIQIDSFGPGFWGNGTPILNAAGTGFFGSGEVHGVIKLPGSYDSITFTHTNENWHGFTVGVTGLIPEPEIYAMLLAGLGLVGLFARRRNENKV